MNQILRFIGTVVLTACIPISAQDSTMSLSLAQACKIGIDKNVNLQNARLEQQKMHYKLKESTSRLYPHLEGYSTFNYYYAIPKTLVPGEVFGQTGLIPVEFGTKYDWSSGFKATQVLYNQCAFAAVNLANRMAELSSMSVQQKKEEIVYQISQVYYLCLATGNQIALLQTSMKNIDQLLEISRLQSENGVIRKVDYSRVMVTKSNLQTQIDNLNRLHQEQTGLLKFLAGIETHTSIALTDSLTAPVDSGSLHHQNIEPRIELQLFDKQIQVASLNLKISRESHLPSLAAFAQHYYQAQNNDHDFFKDHGKGIFQNGLIGISLSVPIFDGFEISSQTKQIAIDLQELQNSRKNTQEFLSKESVDATRAYTASHIAADRQKKNIETAEEVYAISLQTYRENVASLSDLLLSESSLIEARLSYLNALLQVKTASLDVKKAEGALLSF
jgi:outer membrane protein TolC